MGKLPARIKVKGQVYRLASDRRKISDTLSQHSLSKVQDLLKNFKGEDYFSDKIRQLTWNSSQVASSLLTGLKKYTKKLQKLGSYLSTEQEQKLIALFSATVEAWEDLNDGLGKLQRIVNKNTKLSNEEILSILLSGPGTHYMRSIPITDTKHRADYYSPSELSEVGTKATKISQELLDFINHHVPYGGGDTGVLSIIDTLMSELSDGYPLPNPPKGPKKSPSEWKHLREWQDWGEYGKEPSWRELNAWKDLIGKYEYAKDTLTSFHTFLKDLASGALIESKEDEPEEPLYYGASVKPKYIKVKGHLYRRAAGYNLDEDTGLEFPDIGYAEDGKPYPRKDPAVRGKDIAPSELIHTVLEALRAGPSGEKFVREVFLGKSTSLSSILDAIKEVQKQNLDSVGVSQGNAVSLFLKELDIISPRR